MDFAINLILVFFISYPDVIYRTEKVKARMEEIRLETEKFRIEAEKRSW